MGCGGSKRRSDPPIDEKKVKNVAFALLNRRVAGKLSFYEDAASLPVIGSKAEALAIQQKMIELAASPKAPNGPVYPNGVGPKMGWKIGGWPTDGVLGPLFKNAVHPSPATLSISSLNMGVIEAELAFVLAKDLPPRSKPYKSADIWAATAKLHLVIEACGLRCGSPFQWLGAACSPEYKLADACVNAAVVVGPELSVDQCRDADLAAQKAEIKVNGFKKAEGSGAEVKGHPVESVVWLANQKVVGLKAGDLIISGAFCKLSEYYREADVIVASFDGLGDVSLTVER